jgi:hypothetical protein
MTVGAGSSTRGGIAHDVKLFKWIAWGIVPVDCEHDTDLIWSREFREVGNATPKAIPRATDGGSCRVDGASCARIVRAENMGRFSQL